MNTETSTESALDATPSFLRDLWYLAALSNTVLPGQMRRKILLGEPLVIGRLRDGKTFALRDICPHRGVPLSAGRILDGNTIECPYHGWQFRSDGVCALIPSLVEEKDLDASRIKVNTYPVCEQDGLIWVFFPGRHSQPIFGPPKVDVPNSKPRWHIHQTFHCHMDHAVIGLMDPTHAAYVHARWWWRRPQRLKEKAYGPLERGFVMKRHPPSKPAYKILGGDVTTEITFELPGIRFENIRSTLFGRQTDVVGLTACTPIDAQSTQVTQIFYWPLWLGFIRPIFMALGSTFLGDDRRMVELQREGLKFNPRLMLIRDADQPAIWYHRLKKAWVEAAATGAPFINPVQETTLRWRS